MDEGYGTKAYDQSGNGNAGTASGSPVWADGKLGKSLDFNGTSDYLSIANEANFDFERTNTFTLSAWIYRKTSNTEDAILGKTENNTTWRGYALYLQPNGGCNGAGNNCVELDITSAGGNVISVESPLNSVPNNSWTHIVATYNGSSGASGVTLYINGTAQTPTVLENSLTSSILNNNNFTLGTDLAGETADYFNGLIDEVRVYNRALTAGEVTRLYNLTKPKIKAASDTGLVGYWSFEEGMGTKAGDMSGRGNHGIFGVGLGEDPPSWTTGKRGGALQFTASQFDQNNPWIDLGTNFNVSLPFTISAWINPVDSYSYPTIISKRDSFVSNNMRFSLQLDSDGGSEGQVRFQGNTTSERLFDYVPALNAWTQITVIAQAGSTNLYVNGVFQQSLSGVTLGTDTTARAGIGRNGETTTNNDAFHGKIDEVRIYNRALSATEVANLYNASKKIMKVNAPQNTKLTDGLVGMWTFNGQDVSGSIALDRSGQGNNGTIVGATLDSGKVGQAMSFDGSDDYVSANASASLNNLSQKTLSAWIYPRSAGEGDEGKIAGKNQGGVNGWEWYLCSNNSGGGCPSITNTIVFQENRTVNRGGWRLGANSITMNTWQHVAITYDNTSTTSDPIFYFNGTATATTEIWVPSGNPSDDSAINLGIGSRTNGSLAFNGTLDEVRLYSRALSADEVKRLYNMGR